MRNQGRTRFVCSACGRKGQRATSVEQARVNVLKYGWVLRDDLWLCWKCSRSGGQRATTSSRSGAPPMGPGEGS